MKLKEKISLEKVFEKEYKIKLVEPENNKEAIITHFLHKVKTEFHSFLKRMRLNIPKKFYNTNLPKKKLQVL